MKQFLAKLREQFRVLAKKAAGKLGEEDLQESRVPDTSELRRGLMGLRRIVFSLISINAEEKGFFQIIMKVPHIIIPHSLLKKGCCLSDFTIFHDSLSQIFATMAKRFRGLRPYSFALGL